ncbi:MAG TPA: hypothetical protein VMW44_00145, partial [Candidatus Bathyarchaeia archaeon]|nr:hypothetical protein [Candidatus Bathyarchaeia archaeon]
TITSKPEMKPVPVDVKRAGFGTLTQAAIVDDPETKLNILSKGMGIPRERFGMVKGRPVYQGDDGILYYVTPKNEKLKGMAAEQIAHSPATVLATVGAAAGPAGAGLGAIAGESIRKITGSLIYKEPQKPLETLKDLAVEGGLAYVGTKYLGGGTIKAIDRSKGKAGATLIRLAESERKWMKPHEIKRIDELAKKWKIQLFSPQTTKSNELIARFNLLGDLPVTADKIGRARLKQYAEINDAVNKWLNTFGKATTTPRGAGEKGVEVAGKAIQRAKDARTLAAKSQYDEAMKVKGLDISGTMSEIDTMLKTAPRGTPEQRSLNRIKTMLTRTAKDAKGNEIKIPEDRLEVLDKVKKAINGMWKKDPKSAPEINEQRSINKILESMLSKIDEEVPIYKEARKIFQEGSPAVTRLTKGKVGEIAKLQGDKIENAAKMIFSPSQSSPEIIASAKPQIIKQGGQKAWDALLRVHLKQRYRDTVKTGTQNIGGQLRKKIFGDIDQREILKAAMSKPQYKNFNDLMEVLERTGLTAGKESTTVPRLVSAAQLSEEAAGLSGKVMRAVAYPLYTGKRIIVDFRLKLKSEKYMDMLADAMIAPETSKQLQTMLQLKPGSQKLIQQLSAFLTLVGGGHLHQEWQKKTTRDIRPKTRLVKPRRIRGGGR